MARLLPLFPLDIVVFPGEKLNLHIFEPCYKQLVADCFQAGLPFGIPAFLKNGVSNFGTIIKILEVEKSPGSDELDIKTKGSAIFRIDQFFPKYPDKEYAGGKINEIENIEDEDPVLKARITTLLEQLYNALGLTKLVFDLKPDYKIFDIGHHIGLTTEQEFELLTAESESTRQEIVLEHLEAVVPVVIQTEKLKDRVKLNGHYKNLVPPNF